MTTGIKLSPHVPDNVQYVDDPTKLDGLDCPAFFRLHQCLIVDGIRWQTDLDALLPARIAKHKPYDKKAGCERPEGRAGEALDSLVAEIAEICGRLYPRWDLSRTTHSIRRMRTGPEPVHYDSFVSNGDTQAIAFVNFDRAPREWRLSYTLPEFARRFPIEIATVLEKADREEVKFNKILRERYLRRQPFHKIHFARGSLWVLNPKTVSHGVDFGCGAVLWAARSNAFGAKTQAEILGLEWAQ